MFKIMERGGSLLIHSLFSCEVASRIYRGCRLLAQRVKEKQIQKSARKHARVSQCIKKRNQEMLAKMTDVRHS